VFTRISHNYYITIMTSYYFDALLLRGIAQRDNWSATEKRKRLKTEERVMRGQAIL